jgi:hypothetical protein
MPLYDSSGKPLGPAAVIGAKKLTDYAPLTDAELKVVVDNLEQGLAHGIPDETPVTMATGILVRLVRSVQVAATTATPAPPAPEMPWMERMPVGRELRLTPEQLEAALTAAHEGESK